MGGAGDRSRKDKRLVGAKTRSRFSCTIGGGGEGGNKGEIGSGRDTSNGGAASSGGAVDDRASVRRRRRGRLQRRVWRDQAAS